MSVNETQVPNEQTNVHTEPTDAQQEAQHAAYEKNRIQPRQASAEHDGPPGSARVASDLNGGGRNPLGD